MKPEVNALLAEVKAQMSSMDQAKPEVDINSLRLPDFSTMSIMEATKWCMEHGIEKGTDIAHVTGKKLNTVHTAQWKLRNPKRVKVLQRRAKKAKAKAKAGVANVAKTKKPKIENGLYDDGMETPMFDAIMRRGSSGFVPPRSLEIVETKTTQIHNELMAENRRLKILVEHYETLLFKGGK